VPSDAYSRATEAGRDLMSAYPKLRDQEVAEVRGVVTIWAAGGTSWKRPSSPRAAARLPTAWHFSPEAKMVGTTGFEPVTSAV